MLSRVKFDGIAIERLDEHPKSAYTRVLEGNEGDSMTL